MRRVEFKKFAGVKIRGTEEMEKPTSNRHIDRAVWLTAHVESGGKFGCAMNYDGTGMTASIGQAIAVYPRGLADDVKTNDQGPLWRVLNRIQSSTSTWAWSELFEELKNIGWFVSEDGKCRSIKTGKLISGRAIRKEFTGSADGVMPIKGPDRRRAQQWAERFHSCFGHPSTFETQLALEKEHFVKRATRVKLRFCRDEVYRGCTLQEMIYDPHHISSITADQMGEGMDLAMCMYWSNSVNAPSFALKKFCRQVIDNKMCFYPFDRAKHIIQKLGNTPFARWDDDIKNGRYQRTRRYAMKLWPRHLFVGPDAIMPKNLVG